MSPAWPSLSKGCPLSVPLGQIPFSPCSLPLLPCPLSPPSLSLISALHPFEANKFSLCWELGLEAVLSPLRGPYNICLTLGRAPYLLFLSFPYCFILIVYTFLVDRKDKSLSLKVLNYPEFWGTNDPYLSVWLIKDCNNFVASIFHL